MFGWYNPRSHRERWSYELPKAQPPHSFTLPSTTATGLGCQCAETELAHTGWGHTWPRRQQKQDRELEKHLININL